MYGVGRLLYHDELDIYLLPCVVLMHLLDIRYKLTAAKLLASILLLSLSFPHRRRAAARPVASPARADRSGHRGRPCGAVR